MRTAVHIVLLAFANLCSCSGKQVKYFRKHRHRGFRYPSVALYRHHVSGQDCGIVVPFPVYCRESAPDVGFVHHVIVDKRESMENLKCGSRLKYFVAEAVLEKRIYGQTQTRSDAFASYADHISQRIIKPGRFFRESDVLEHPFQNILNLCLVYHNLVFLDVAGNCPQARDGCRKYKNKKLF